MKKTIFLMQINSRFSMFLTFKKKVPFVITQPENWELNLFWFYAWGLKSHAVSILHQTLFWLRKNKTHFCLVILLTGMLKLCLRAKCTDVSNAHGNEISEDNFEASLSSRGSIYRNCPLTFTWRRAKKKLTSVCRESICLLWCKVRFKIRLGKVENYL